MRIKVPCKTFVFGEYAVLEPGGIGCLQATYPGFVLEQPARFQMIQQVNLICLTQNHLQEGCGKNGSASSSLFSDAAVGEWASASMNKPPKGLGRSSAEFVATWLTATPRISLIFLWVTDTYYNGRIG